MGHLAGEGDLLLEALQGLGVARDLWPEGLEGDAAAEFLVLRLVDFPHPPRGDEAHHAVAPRHQVPRGEGPSRSGDPRAEAFGKPDGGLGEEVIRLPRPQVLRRWVLSIAHFPERLPSPPEKRWLHHNKCRM